MDHKYILRTQFSLDYLDFSKNATAKIHFLQLPWGSAKTYLDLSISDEKAKLQDKKTSFLIEYQDKLILTDQTTNSRYEELLQRAIDTNLLPEKLVKDITKLLRPDLCLEESLEEKSKESP